MNRTKGDSQRLETGCVERDVGLTAGSLVGEHETTAETEEAEELGCGTGTASREGRVDFFCGKER